MKRLKHFIQDFNLFIKNVIVLFEVKKNTTSKNQKFTKNKTRRICFYQTVWFTMVKY